MFSLSDPHDMKNKMLSKKIKVIVSSCIEKIVENMTD